VQETLRKLMVSLHSAINFQ